MSKGDTTKRRKTNERQTRAGCECNKSTSPFSHTAVGVQINVIIGLSTCIWNIRERTTDTYSLLPVCT